MIIKRFSTIALTLFAAAALFTGCNADKEIYSGAERILFADTLATYAVTSDGKSFEVPVASTIRCDYDRTFGVEIVDKGSTAIENFHYRLESPSVTIKAGEGATNVRILANYDNIEPRDSIGVVLRLVIPEQLEWDLYNQQTKVVFMKCCPFNAADWLADGANYILYASFPISESSTERRLVKAEKISDNRLKFKGLFTDEYDLTMSFDTTDPLNPSIEVLPQYTFMAANFGQIKSMTVAGTSNFFYSCQHYIAFYMESYSEGVGSFGIYPYLLEWITQKEADYYANMGVSSAQPKE